MTRPASPTSHIWAFLRFTAFIHVLTCPLVVPSKLGLLAARNLMLDADTLNKMSGYSATFDVREVVFPFAP
ncbi:uncharacterized protein IAS62_003561 [Cryptococcus decagattii]|uniref:Uncharacterized protein n=1 Tax=Cryptococcus decagattii TaxID=1859122 RepID=A0ABZ2AYH6_9TREE